jgi:hypothetical protein
MCRTLAVAADLPSMKCVSKPMGTGRIGFQYLSRL